MTITREAPSIVTAAYTFNKNTLRVTQGTLGSGARTAWAPSTFPTTVKCSTDSGLVGVKTFTAAAGTSHAVTGLPTGASCEISQPDSGADALTFTPASLLEVRGDTGVNVSARFDAGKVRLSAAVEGPAAGAAWVPSTFPVDVICRSDRFGEVLDETLTPSVATAALSSGLPVDTSCALQTGDYRQARTATTADVVEISNTSVVDVEISNTYEAGEPAARHDVCGERSACLVGADNRRRGRAVHRSVGR
ncbi:DUF5979 domain-containing protein [Demequina litorisediminis]|uniref:DUF5979 domain-containing protein n=1 Tax=Demequina litorisediminis TaxID=1849022 RepID=UPI0024E0A4FA|nr:DUF5979 domain-containing protein [Demequina litorisediminis]